MTKDQMDLNALVGKSADGDFLRVWIGVGSGPSRFMIYPFELA